jgi:assimilatory nitrate reductase catalytic subunit
VDSLVHATVDPISGQPEFKHTPVNITRYKPVWHAFILSRTALSPSTETYWVKVKGEQFWRYELAGDSQIEDMQQWMYQQLGEEGEWLEFEDISLGTYRAAKLVDKQLQSVAFIGTKYELPTRSWLSQLFLEPTISDEVRQGLLSASAGSGLPDVGPIVCACFGVGKNTLIDAINDEQADTVEKLGTCLKAGTNCGSCIPELKKLLSSAG